MSRPETGRTGARFGAPARRSRHAPDPEAAHGRPVDGPGSDSTPPPDPPAEELVEAASAVGLTGARFGGRARPSRRERQAEKEREAARDRAPVAPEPAEDPRPEPGPESEDARPTELLPRFVDEPGLPIAARPYVLTGGRTKVRAELRIETLVSTVPRPGAADTETGERHAVLRLCTRPRSVSEVAALTKVPLGVARVLIDDLATEGRVRVHLGVDAATGPDMELLDRVLSGLRRL